MKSEDLDLLLKTIKDRVVASVDVSVRISDDELFDMIREGVKEEAAGKLLLPQRKALADKIFSMIRGFDILEPLLSDDEITEIMINGYDNIFVERRGRLERLDKHFESPERLYDIIQRIAASSNRLVNESVPILDTVLKNGSRVNIVLSPVALDGSAVTIRKFRKSAITMKELVKTGSLTQESASFLETLVKNRANIFVSGGTGSGKTTFLNALSEFIDPSERVISIEDSAELKLFGIHNLVRLETRNSNVEGKNEITIRDLIRSSLRMRPDRIIIGEVRGKETVDLLQALNTGHSGSLSTGHANTATDMLSRLETMYLMGMDIPLVAIRGQIAQALDLLVHLKRFRDGRRRVGEIVEIIGMKDSVIETNVLFSHDEDLGQLKKVSDIKSKRLRAIYDRGI